MSDILRQRKSVRLPNGEVISFPVQVCPVKRARGCLLSRYTAKPKYTLGYGDSLQVREQTIR